MLSIGGWTYSSSLGQGASTAARRATFATTAVGLLKNLGLDGLDIDWEYPANADQAQQYVDLLAALRLELDSYALSINLPRDQFELSVAAPAGIDTIQQLRIKDMDQYLSFWNVMCYDYAGSWSTTAGYHSNLFQGSLNTDSALKAYINAGVAPSKLVMGMPIYGRSFTNTDGVGKPFSGVGTGSWEAGSWDYKVLPLSGATEQMDMTAVSAYSYDPSSRTLITYDNEQTIRVKAEYVQRNGLGGGMWWESSSDDPCRSLVKAFTDVIGVGSIDQKQNCLYYPQSTYTNVKS